MCSEVCQKFVSCFPFVPLSPHPSTKNLSVKRRGRERSKLMNLTNSWTFFSRFLSLFVNYLFLPSLLLWLRIISTSSKCGKFFSAAYSHQTVFCCFSVWLLGRASRWGGRIKKEKKREGKNSGKIINLRFFTNKNFVCGVFFICFPIKKTQKAGRNFSPQRMFGKNCFSFFSASCA